jgi:protein PhnA
MSDENKCPKCDSGNTYQDINLWVCLECSNEWDPSTSASDADSSSAPTEVVDSNGNVLKDGDSVVLIKDLKVKGAQTDLKVGTKVKNIRLIESNDGHDIDCKIAGFGGMYLKSEFVKKV